MRSATMFPWDALLASQRLSRTDRASASTAAGHVFLSLFAVVFVGAVTQARRDYDCELLKPTATAQQENARALPI